MTVLTRSPASAAGGGGLSPEGDGRPRLWSFPPGGVSSAAQEFIELAALCGLILDPWQRWVLEHMLAEGADGLWLCYEILLIVARQNGKGSILAAPELAGPFVLH